MLLSPTLCPSCFLWTKSKSLVVSKASPFLLNDKLNREDLESLKSLGVKVVALRSAGFNNVDTAAAKEIGLQVVHVPHYSPESVAEFTLGLFCP